MAAGAGEEYLVETDFLFGLRAGDRNFEAVVGALRRCKSGAIKLSVPSSSVVEARAVLYSKGLKPNEVEVALGLMGAKLAENGVMDFIQIELADAVYAERLRIENPNLGFFDSLHAAAAARRGKLLLTSNKAYKGITSLKVRDLSDFVP